MKALLLVGVFAAQLSAAEGRFQVVSLEDTHQHDEKVYPSAVIHRIIKFDTETGEAWLLEYNSHMTGLNGAPMVASVWEPICNAKSTDLVIEKRFTARQVHGADKPTAKAPSFDPSQPYEVLPSIEEVLGAEEPSGTNAVPVPSKELTGLQVIGHGGPGKTNSVTAPNRPTAGEVLDSK